MLEAGPRRRHSGRRLVGGILAAAVVLSGCTTDAGGPSGSGRRGQGSGGPTSSGPSAAAPAAGTTDAVLAAAGVQIVADERAPAPLTPGTLTLTRVQADRMISEQAAGRGLLGARSRSPRRC